MIDIYNAKYDYGSGSKANRMRAFWEHESSYLVGRALNLLFTEWNEFRGYGAPDEPPEECLRLVRRLKESAPVPDIEAVPPNFEDVAGKLVFSGPQRQPEPQTPRAVSGRVVFPPARRQPARS
jgi:hypothetical protein